MPGPSSKTSTSFRERLKARLSQTRQALFSDIGQMGDPACPDNTFEAIETRLLLADVGVGATQKTLDKLRKQARGEHQLMEVLGQVLLEQISACQKPIDFACTTGVFVILVVGVNGVGKTTTIGKLASRLHRQEKKVMLVAGDTFRAGAIDQLNTWGERHALPVIASSAGADPASVVYDAACLARSDGVDVLLVDTAGRLHNQSNLMAQLAKVKRVLKKIDPESPHETLLVLDAGTGQNALSQTQAFHSQVGVSGLALTKLDGTAKAGVVFALSEQFQLPIRYVGIGEHPDDLCDFNAQDFIDALLNGGDRV